MTSSDYLNNQFLIAMPNLTDSLFTESVSYLCQHNKEGALAIVINRPSEMTLGTIFEQMGISTTLEQVKEVPVFSGGPVQQERGFIIHSKSAKTWDSSISTSESTSLTSSRDILESIAEGKGPDNYLIALGYAGWFEGQLEKEILNNSWLNSPFADNILYHTPAEQRWQAAAEQIGIDINKLSSFAGHG